MNGSFQNKCTVATFQYNPGLDWQLRSRRNSYLCTKGVTTMTTPGERWIQLEGSSPRDGYRSMTLGDAVVHTRFYFSLYVFLKKKKIGIFAITYELMRALWIHYARLFLLITPCFIPRLLWTCLRISYPRSYHAIILKWIIKEYKETINLPIYSFQFTRLLERCSF
jgi:hypothetical protein